MKKFVSAAVATALVVGTSANAVAAPVIDRGAVSVTEGEELQGSGALLIVLLAAAAIAGIIIAIEDSEDPDSLPTSP